MTDSFDQAYWDNRYGTGTDVWSGSANPVLVTETVALPAGRALDVGCGEGADSIWLAGRGWQVTAVDFSGVALERAAARSRRAGADETESAEIAARIGWEQHDLTRWTPPATAFDLVSAQFMHLPSTERKVLFAALAGAVSPGGTLLIVGHDIAASHDSSHTPSADLFFTAEETAASLDPDRWQVEVAESRSRTAADSSGATVLLADQVLRARRR
jgi:2-polyprenyl-3-methyl-5-hydroxy-6-metoxy-1,4-benzoquinol methylase